MRLFSLVVVLFFSFNCLAQNNDEKLSLELIKELQNSTNAVNQLDTYEKLVLSALDKNDSLAFEYAQKMYDLAVLSELKHMQGVALYYLGVSNLELNKTKALEFFKEALPILETNEDENLKDVYFHLSNIYVIFSDFPKSLQSALTSLEINQALEIDKNIQRDMSYIGYIFDRMYEFKESIKWNRKALQIAKKLNDKEAEAICYGRIGIAYDELAEKDNFNKKLFDSALYYNLTAVKLSEEVGNLGFARTTYSNIGNSYSKLKDYDKAEEYTIKSLAVPGFDEKKGVTLVNLGKIYLETERYDQARKILDSAMWNTKHYGTRKYELEAYYRFHELDLKLGNSKSALKNYKAYKVIEDSLLNETKTKQIAEMSERYKSAEKEVQLAQTRATIAEKDLDLQQKNIQIYGLAIAALVFIVLGYLLVNQQKLKNRQLQKENLLKNALAKIETQNKLQDQRLRISRDLHDNIGAQLTFIISSIDNLKYGFNIEDNMLTNKLTGISNFTKETIYELRDTIWAMNKNEINFDDLQSRISNFIDKANIASKGIQFSFNVADEVSQDIKFTSVEGMNLYRIIQEAINNSIKHSKASEINVLISLNENGLVITITDNGIGFDKDKVELSNGVNNMEKRASEINAQLNIQSQEENGTTITILKR
jgi:signal transduction histidine kinase